MKRHLYRGGKGENTRAACGATNPDAVTRVLSSVTCLTCQRSLLMADLEFREKQNKKRGRSNQ